MFPDLKDVMSGVGLVHLESFRVRPLSGSKEDTYEVQRGMQLHDEESNRPMFGNVNDSVSVGRFSHKHDITESSNENPRKRTVQEYNYLYTYLSTILYALILVIESIFQFRWIHHSHSSISFFWLESCVIALFFKICGRKRITRSQVRHFRALLVLHIAVGVMFGLDYNQATFASSGGSESFCVFLTLVPPQVLLASWLVNRESYPDVIIVVVAFTSFLLMLTFCSMQDSIANYKVTFLNGTFGFMMAASMAFYSASPQDLLYLLNLSSVVCLPFFALAFGEYPLLKAEIFKRGAATVISRVFKLAILRLARQAASLIQLTHSTPLLNVVTRGFAWIWITIEITLYTHVQTGELFIPVFYAFWIYGFGMFLPVLISDLRWI
ncbi:hypothetical protein P5673_006161 [Acropora cervicornis]|uniref:Uncharacterized protein n=1 Tax=Acropora cervicornis TaxID=6130 RepID=A0AAD9VCG9_ACRCE|nr:hypothetical protein P5673_006161 [Acropora cervicornis]